MLKGLARLIKEEKGQGMVEYGLIIALVGIALIAALTGLTGGLSSLFGKAKNTVQQ